MYQSLSNNDLLADCLFTAWTRSMNFANVAFVVVGVVYLFVCLGMLSLSSIVSLYPPGPLVFILLLHPLQE